MVYCFTSFHLIVTFSPRFTITWEHWLLRATSLVLPHRTSSPEIPQPLPDLGTCHHLTWVLRFDSKGPEDEPQEGRLGFKAGLRAFLASVQETEVLLVCGPQLMRPWRQKGEPWRFPLLSGCLGFLRCQSTTLGKLLPVLSPVLCLLREHTPGLPASYGDGGQEYSVAFKLSFPTGFFPSSPSKSVLQPVSGLSLCDPTRQTQSVCSRTFSKAFTLFRHQLVPWFGPSSLLLGGDPSSSHWTRGHMGFSWAWEFCVHLAESPPPTEETPHLCDIIQGGHSQSFFHLFHPARQLFGCGEKVSFLNLMGSTFILGVCFVLLMDCPSEKFVAGPHSSKGWLTWWYPQRWLFC